MPCALNAGYTTGSPIMIKVPNTDQRGKVSTYVILDRIQYKKILIGEHDNNTICHM